MSATTSDAADRVSVLSTAESMLDDTRKLTDSIMAIVEGGNEMPSDDPDGVLRRLSEVPGAAVGYRVPRLSPDALGVSSWAVRVDDADHSASYHSVRPQSESGSPPGARPHAATSP